jgi:hypothetical protein
MLILIVSAFLVGAQAGAPAAPTAAPAAKPVKEKKICRSDVTTGSILPKSVCRTRQQWDDIELANRNTAPFRREILQTTASPRSQ